MKKELEHIAQSLIDAKVDADGVTTYTNGNFKCSVLTTGYTDVSVAIRAMCKYRPIRHNTSYMHKETATSKILGAINKDRSLIEVLPKKLAEWEKKEKTVGRWVGGCELSWVKTMDKDLRKMLGEAFSLSDIRYALSILPPAWRKHESI